MDRWELSEFLEADLRTQESSDESSVDSFSSSHCKVKWASIVCEPETALSLMQTVLDHLPEDQRYQQQRSAVLDDCLCTCESLDEPA
jgi:hypothetical protein